MMATTISANVNLVFDNSTSLTKDDANLVNVIIPILYSLICVIGVLGNSLVLYIMTKMTSVSKNRICFFYIIPSLFYVLTVYQIE